MLDVANRVFCMGQAEVVRKGGDVTLIACGTTVHLAGAAHLLAGQGISAQVVNMATLSPLDDADVLAAAEEVGAIVTVEEASVRGGLGGAVAELTAANLPVPVEHVGLPGFVPTGSVDRLFREYGLTPEGSAAAAHRALKRVR